MKLRARRKFTLNHQPEAQPNAVDAENNKPEARERGEWGNQTEFILSCLGYAMGLGNVWKFPYTCFSNGGGAYLIPYIVVLTLVGIPAFFLELIMGQYSGKGPVEIWCLAPIFHGVGVGMLLISGMINVFYTMLLAYCLYYFAMCFQTNLPWDSCAHSYNSPVCFNPKESKPCTDAGGIFYNRTCFNETTLNMTGEWEKYKNLTKKLIPSSQEYFFNGVLERSDSINDTNGVKMELALCLLAMWILCLLCLLKGIQSSGKVVYFTTTFPYVVLTILLIRGALLEGSIVGIKYYLTPEWRRLGDAKVWGDAAGQIFFALGVGASGLITYASYSPFHSNIYRTALVVAVANSCTDWYAGFVVFSALGYMATIQGTEVKNVVAEGAGLAFIVYPQVLAQLPIPQLWSAMFFFMLILLGLDSLNAGVEALITATVDKWPKLRRFKYLVAFFWCSVFFLLGLPMCTRAGFYWLDLVSYYSSGWTLVVIGIIEVIIYCWIYGSRKIMNHVQEMVGFRLLPHWWFVWTFVTPLLLIAVFIFNLISFTPIRWNDVDPPVWAPVLGWMMTLSPLAVILIFGIIIIIKTYAQPNTERLSCCRRFQLLFLPSKNWMSSEKLKELEDKKKKEASGAEPSEKETSIDEDGATSSTGVTVESNDNVSSKEAKIADIRDERDEKENEEEKRQTKGPSQPMAGRDANGYCSSGGSEGHSQHSNSSTAHSNGDLPPAANGYINPAYDNSS